MAPIGPLLPGELAPDHTDMGHTGHHSTASSSSSRRRSHSITTAMLSAAEPEPPLSRSPSSATVITSDSRTTTSRAGGGNIREKLGLGGVARRTLGIGLLLIVVFLWTLSNFMASVSPTIPSTFNIT
jgi:solute carrier family 35 protein F5